jgi:hypothetical protein
MRFQMGRSRKPITGRARSPTLFRSAIPPTPPPAGRRIVSGKIRGPKSNTDGGRTVSPCKIGDDRRTWLNAYLESFSAGGPTASPILSENRS